MAWRGPAEAGSLSGKSFHGTMKAAAPKRGERTAGTHLGVRASTAEREVIRAAAADRGSTVSDLVRQALKAHGVQIEA